MTTLQVFDTNALKYENLYMHLNLYNHTYDRFLERLPLHSKVLEIGCGPGNIPRYILNKRPDLRWLATDFSPNMIELAKKNLPEAETLLLDAKQIDSLNQKFDAVVCGFVAPYFAKAELEKFLSECVGVLNPEGKLYISFIKGNHADSGWKSSSDGKNSAFVHYYEESDVAPMLSKSGFAECAELELPFKDDVHIVMIAALG